MTTVSYDYNLFAKSFYLGTAVPVRVRSQSLGFLQPQSLEISSGLWYNYI